VLQGTAAAPARNRAYFDGKICLKNRVFHGLEHLQMGFKQIGNAVSVIEEAVMNGLKGSCN
jgi:hypothetical protein